MKKTLEPLHYHWTFIFAFLWTTAMLFFQFHFLIFLLWILLVIRIILLKNNLLLKLMLFSFILFSFISLNKYLSSDQLASFVQEEEEVQLSLRVDPLDINAQENYLSAKGVLKNGEKIDIIYYHDGQLEVLNGLKTSQNDWLVGGIIRRPKTRRNFHLFDYATYLASNDIYWEIEIFEILDVKKSKHWTALFANFRAYILQPFKDFDDNSWMALHNKILWNLDSAYYREMQSNFARWGIIHFFAVSGLHIHFIIKFIRYLFLRMGMTHETVQKLVVAVILLYGFLIAWPVGVIRAVGVYLGKILIKHFQLNISPLDCLALIGIGLLLFNPKIALSLSFILSFLMTYIVHFSRTTKVNDSSIKQAVQLTISCLLFSWPIVLQQNFEWNSLQLLMSLIFAVLFEKVIMPAVFSTSIFFLLPGKIIRNRLFHMVNIIYSFLMKPLNQLTTFASFIVTTGYLSLVRQLLLWAGAFIWLKRSEKHFKQSLLVVSAIYLFVIFMWPYADIYSKVTIIDVGQGDALLYQPAFSNKHWLIDTGGRMTWGESATEDLIDQQFAQRNIIPALKALGVNQIDGLIISHPDIDHMGNLFALVQNIPIKQYIISSYTEQSELWLNFLRINSIAESKILVMEQGDRLVIGQLALYALINPALAYDSDASNNSSLIARIQLGNVFLLNIADIDRDTELKLLQQIRDLKASIIKLGHHGSRNSSHPDFISQLKPQLALISAGESNRYQHPHQEVLDILEEKNIPYLSTKDRGAIQISYSKLTGLKIQTVIDS